MKVSIQVRYTDFDRMGHLNNAAYATYFEVARLNFLINLFETHSYRWTDVVANLNIDYKIPMVPGNTPEIEIKCSRIGNSSYDLTYSLYEKTAPNIIYATGKTVQVRIDDETQQALALDDRIRGILEDNT